MRFRLLSRRILCPLLLAGRTGCTPQPPPEAQPGPSVLIITLDTTRADRLGPYGYALADTPIYDQLAAEGLLFRRAYSTCPLTIPSHATIFTGRAPPSHGVRDNGDFILGDDAVTLAERFKEVGYSTAAFTSAFPTQRRWGFSQGFDVYHDPLERLPTDLDWRDERPADVVIDDALTTLPTLDGPQFVWVHLFDAHFPYAPPPPYDEKYKGRPYDGEIAFAAHQVERLIQAWDAAHESSVVVVTSDHGEGLGEGGEMTHGFLLHDGTIRVPLILRTRGIEDPGYAPGSEIEDPVGHTDIAPTVLALAGVAGDGLLQGQDLRTGGSEKMYSEALTGQFNLGLAPLYAYTDESGRYMEGGWGATYLVNQHKVGTVPLRKAPTSPEAVALAALRAQLDEVVAPSASLAPDDFAMLQALGYLGGDTQAEAGEIDPRDVIDVVPLTWRARQVMSRGQLDVAQQMINTLAARMPDTWGVDLLQAQLLRNQGRFPAAREAFIDLYRRAPGSTSAQQVASLYAMEEDWVEAESWFQEALRLQPASPEAMAGVVRSNLNLGNLELARQLTDEYLLVYPDHAHLALVRARILALDGQLDEAAIEARRALAQMPFSPWAHTVCADILWRQGQTEEAVSLQQEALRLDPAALQQRMALSRMLLEVGRNAEAVRTMRPAGRVFGDLPAVQQLVREADAALAAELSR